ncbi:hypothetical protein BJX61DRAFT_544587 [Aspergillus egyptiacus]|nr:hypothetical protein BJX61DRAFT_544587 [Aspergillus egyptiacus]
MARNLYTFVADIENKLIAQDDFYKGLLNFYNRLLETSGIPPENQLPSYLGDGREALDSHPQLLGAHCIRGASGMNSDHFKKATFEYETIPSARNELEMNASDLLLMAAVKGLAFLTDSEARDHDMDSSPLRVQRKVQEMLIGASFSTRSLKDLEPAESAQIETSRPQTVVDQQELDEEGAEELDISKFSIGGMVEWFFGPGWSTLQDAESFGGWKRAVENWLLLLNAGNFEKLLPHLSVEQAYSVRILMEWWDGAIDFEPAIQRSRDVIRRSAASGVNPRDLGIPTEQYQEKMMGLFEYEFHPQYYPLWLSGSMSPHRGLRAGTAAAQRLSMTVYKDLISRSGDGSGMLPVHDSDDIRLRDVAAEHSKRLTASVSPCPWLSDADAGYDMPYYLWDIQRRCTVPTQKLQGKVEYTAISHTWGRWKKHDCPSVHVEGVDGWSIPQNTRFNVTELPTILSSACLETRYVWFDLLCIPQMPESEQLQLVARDEIARQAKIFRGAKHAAAWFNDVAGWAGLHAVLRQLAVRWLQSQEELPAWLLSLAESDSQTELELYTPQGEEEPGVMNGWFSSLWTLQELCLRPDMILLSRQWCPFAIHTAPVRLVDLAALMSACEGIRGHTSTDLPPSSSTEALHDLLNDTGIIAIGDAGRVDILSMGNQRTCTGNRAEAIMSALSVTDWYSSISSKSAAHDDKNSQSCPQQYVASDRYPLPFIREAALKIGPEFYAAAFSYHEIILFLANALTPPMMGSLPRSIGTLLPFGNTTTLARRVLPKGGVVGSPHPSIRTWTIQDDLSVEIHQAAVISYTGQVRAADRAGKITGILCAPSLEEDYIPLHVDVHEGVDLDHWVDSFYLQTRNFAVCLSYASTAVEGVLLKETVTGDLVKVGLFWVTGFDFTGAGPPETYEVDWRVL